MNNMSKQLSLTGIVASLNRPKKWTNFKSEVGSQIETTLRPLSLGPSCVEDFNLEGTQRKLEDIDGGMIYVCNQQVTCFPCLPSAPKNSKKSSSGDVSIVSSAYMAGEECSMNQDFNFQLEIVTQNLNILNAPAITTLETLDHKPTFNIDLSIGLPASSITSEAEIPMQHLMNQETSIVNFSELINGSVSSSQQCESSLISFTRELPKSPVDCAFDNIKNKNHNSSTKKCQFLQCQKRAKGASKCRVAHDGGKKYEKARCGGRTEEKTIYYKLYGGGRRCKKLGCIKSAKWSTNFCTAHGRAHCYSQASCTTTLRGKSRFCIKHGGGTSYENNCTKSIGDRSSLCVAHVGGKHCHYEGCKKGAHDSTMFCKVHGGKKICGVEGCDKCVEGSTPFCKYRGEGKHCLFQDGETSSKSVHDMTQLCVAHGGGKRCATPKFTKSTHDQTDHYVFHEGKKRCQLEGCHKNAKESTNFCKTHGGDKRCSWGSQVGLDICYDGPSCNWFSTNKASLCVAHNALVQDHWVHGSKAIGRPNFQEPSASEKMKVIVGEESYLLGWNVLNKKFIHPIIPVKAEVISLPEGRVHGGNLMALLAKGDLNLFENQVEE